MNNLEIAALGHCGFALRYNDTVVLIDPWLDNNRVPDNVDALIANTKAILVTHGHASHLGSSLKLAQKFGCRVHCVHELSQHLVHEGLAAQQSVGMNYGGTCDILPGWSATLTIAMHSTCVLDNDFARAKPAGGLAGGWVVSVGGSSLYHAGDTAIFSDMQLICDLYQPSLAIVPIGGHYCMGPREAAYAIDKLLVGVNTVVPWSSCFAAAQFPVRKGSTAEVQALVTKRGVHVIDLEPGQWLTMPRGDAAAVRFALLYVASSGVCAHQGEPLLDTECVTLALSKDVTPDATWTASTRRLTLTVGARTLALTVKALPATPRIYVAQRDWWRNVGSPQLLFANECVTAVALTLQAGERTHKFPLHAAVIARSAARLRLVTPTTRYDATLRAGDATFLDSFTEAEVVNCGNAPALLTIINVVGTAC